MATTPLIGAGIGFSPGSVLYIITRGLQPNPTAYVDPYTDVPGDGSTVYTDVAGTAGIYMDVTA